MARGGYRYVALPKRVNANQTDRVHWAESVKMQAIVSYLSCGNLTQVSRDLTVPLATLNMWKASDWWKDRVKQIQNEEYDKLDSKLTKALDKALDGIVDKLEKGESMYDPTTGKIIRVPAKLRDLNTSFNTLIDKRQLIRKQPTKIVEQQSTATQLQNLADEFKKFVTGRSPVKEVDEMIELIEGETVEQDPETGRYHVIDPLEKIEET